ncbi:hypothetical protein [Streptomyces sp. ALI-76-A]|uniref:hypothetical protein n=1 Tax=Streptomyces sp. ALI-76-A TaxID=3025736 RepID=UPI003364CE0D
MTVEINARDIALLREFQRITPYYSGVTERIRSTNFAEASRTAVWSLCSLAARIKLRDLGLPCGRKSKKITPPQAEFSPRDYLRGVIDADGSVGHTRQGIPLRKSTSMRRGPYWRYSGRRRKITGAERSLKRNARDGIYNILYTKENAQKLAAHLYYEGCLSLERKKAQADSTGAWVRPAGMRIAPERRHWTAHEDRVLLRLNNDSAAAGELGRTAKSCSIRLWRMRTGRVPLPAQR